MILTNQNCVRVGINNRMNFIFLFALKYLNSRQTGVLFCLFLYGCETWSVTRTEEHRLGLFENRVLRKIFGPKREEIKADWRKLHDTHI